MKRILLSMALSSLLLSAGGDIVPVTPAPVDSWSGFYLGLQTGGVWGDGDITYTDNKGNTFKADGLKPKGLMSGLYGGYNWLFADNWLLGLEGEWNAVSTNDTKIGVQKQFIMGSKLDQNWDASLRLRAGKVIGNYLPYITGGAAWGGFNIKTCFLADCVDRDLTLGGWTVGAGVEMALTPQLHARIQYRYTDYGDDSTGISGLAIPIRKAKLDYNSHMVSVGFSYRPGAEGGYTAESSPSGDGWSGFYAGLQTGGVWGKSDVIYRNGITQRGYANDHFDLDGLTSGLYGGYNWLLADNWLLGVEGEWNYVVAHDSLLINPQAQPLVRARLKENWDASLRLRVGRVMGDFLPYVTGGAAWNRSDLRTCYISDCHEDGMTLTGWTVGAGVEMKLTSRLHARIQYRYTDYGSKTVRVIDNPTFKVDARNDYDSHIVSVGLSYRF